MAICHTCVPDDDEDGDDYQGPSPDEVALAKAAKLLGIQFMSKRTTETHGTICRIRCPPSRLTLPPQVYENSTKDDKDDNSKEDNTKDDNSKDDNSKDDKNKNKKDDNKFNDKEKNKNKNDEKGGKKKGDDDIRKGVMTSGRGNINDERGGGKKGVEGGKGEGGKGKKKKEVDPEVLMEYGWSSDDCRIDSYWRVLNVLEFTSERKCMSIVVQKLYKNPVEEENNDSMSHQSSDQNTNSPGGQNSQCNSHISQTSNNSHSRGRLGAKTSKVSTSSRATSSSLGKGGDLMTNNPTNVQQNNLESYFEGDGKGDSEIILMCKGADTVLEKLLTRKLDGKSITQLSAFAHEGLRVTYYILLK